LNYSPAGRGRLAPETDRPARGLHRQCGGQLQAAARLFAAAIAAGLQVATAAGGGKAFTGGVMGPRPRAWRGQKGDY